MTRVAYTRARDLSPGELPRLSPEERAREFGSAARRRQFQSARWLLRSLLSRFDGQPPDSYRLTSDERGKPACAGGPAISISHAGDVVACAVAASGEVGVDLEEIDLQRQATRLAHRFFAPAEAKWLDTQAPDRFFMLWVLKEAYGKATGEGVVDAFKGLQCLVEPPRIEVLATEVSPLSLHLLQLDNSFLAIAGIEGAPGELEVERWDDVRGAFVTDDRVIEVARN